MQPSTATAPRSLRHNRAFLLFWAGQAISSVGSAMATVALPLLVLASTGTAARMGQVTALLALGSLLAGPLAGVLADRLDRRKLMLGCDLLSALLYGFIPLSWLLAGPQVPLLYGLALPLGFFAVASSVAATACLPRLVDHNQLTAANARFQLSFALAFLIGPLLAGALFALIGASALLALNALSYLFSVATLLLIRLRPASAGPAREEATGMAGVLLAGARLLLADARLRWVVALRLAAVIALGGAFDLVVFRLKTELHQANATVGLVWGLGALGDILAGILTPRLHRRLGFGVCFLGGLGLLGGSVVIIAQSASLAVFLLVGVSLTFGDIVAQITSASLLQAVTPDALQGRVAAAVQTVQYAGTALGAAASTALASRLGSTPPVFLLMGLLLLFLPVLGVFTPARATYSDL